MYSYDIQVGTVTPHTIFSRMTDSTAQTVKKQATTIMMAPTALLVLMMVNEAIQPLGIKERDPYRVIRFI